MHLYPKASLWQGLLLASCLLLAGWPVPANAHDASSWGGLFRSRDGGTTWFQANQGRLVAGALAIAVDPNDPNHLLLGTDAGLLVSHNGGLDWQAAGDLAGAPVFALAFDQVGQRQLAGTDAGLFGSDDGSLWRVAGVPSGGVPVRALIVGRRSDQVYLLGAHGLFRSDDWGGSWIPLDAGLPREAVLGLALTGNEALACLVGGQLWLSADAGQSWRIGPDSVPQGQLQMLVGGEANLWAAGAERLFRSEDGGRSWRSIGRPLPDTPTDIRGVAASADLARVVVSTHRGVYTSLDGGASWDAVTDTLPGHIEAGPLVRDPLEPLTIYVGFALTPYDEQWRRAVDGRSAASRLGLADLVGAAAFLGLLAIGGGMALQWLARRSAPRASASIP
jgi:photosystem II stability/assembly factor-like uncharacterized protein